MPRVVSNAPPDLRRSLSPEADVYAALLRDTRGLRRDQERARESWLAELSVERKEELLFELEVLLKGLACFANPRNHPGPPRRAAIVAQDYREPTVIVRSAMARIVALCRALLPGRDGGFVFLRYLETVLPDDGARTRLVRGDATRDTPEESLAGLWRAMANLLEVTSGAARLPRVPFRMFYALLAVAHREVSQSTYFNPLSALEFRPEFDRITHPQVLTLIRAVPEEHARRLAALVFLSVFRMLRYLDLLEAWGSPSSDASGGATGCAYLVLSVLRSDARALTGHLRRRSGPLLAEGYELEIFGVPSTRVVERYDALLAEGHRLLGLKEAFAGIAANLRLELRRAFDHDFPSPGESYPAPELRARTSQLARNVRPALQNAIVFLGRALGSRLDEQGVFDDSAARRALSERLRRDVWMFAQIVRAFAVKARALKDGAHRWSDDPFHFVREFLTYFRAMGYSLLRASEYPHFDAFLAAMTLLEAGDTLDTLRVQSAVAECETFYVFLSELFDEIGKRVELGNTPFDRRAAAESLRLYLTD